MSAIAEFAAREMLGVTEGASKATIQRAFSWALQAVHPDTAREPNPEMVTKLKAARDCLLRALEVGDNPCKLCGGSGYVRGIQCAACFRDRYPLYQHMTR